MNSKTIASMYSELTPPIIAKAEAAIIGPDLKERVEFRNLCIGYSNIRYIITGPLSRYGLALEYLTFLNSWSGIDLSREINSLSRSMERITRSREKRRQQISQYISNIKQERLFSCWDGGKNHGG